MTPLDRESETYALDVLSIVESVLEDPGVVLAAQLDRLRTETIVRLKREGVEYEERMAELDRLEHPKPRRDFTYGLFDAYAVEHPWVVDHTIRPKSVARDLYERAMTFTEYVAHYRLARSEGLVLRYLSDAYKGLVQTVPEDAKTDVLLDLTEWLGELVRQVDSSLLDEWEALRQPDPEVAADVVVRPPGHEGEAARGVTANARAFRLMVRNELFRWVELLARRGYDELAERQPGGTWRAVDVAAAAAAYWGEHDAVGIDADARSAARCQITETGDSWTVRQVLADPQGHDDWAIVATVDLAASDGEGRAVIELRAVESMG